MVVSQVSQLGSRTTSVDGLKKKQTWKVLKNKPNFLHRKQGKKKMNRSVIVKVSSKTCLFPQLLRDSGEIKVSSISQILAQGVKTVV